MIIASNPLPHRPCTRTPPHHLLNRSTPIGHRFVLTEHGHRATRLTNSLDRSQRSSTLTRRARPRSQRPQLPQTRIVAHRNHSPRGAPRPFPKINSEFNLLNANRRRLYATINNNQKTDREAAMRQFTMTVVALVVFGAMVATAQAENQTPSPPTVSHPVKKRAVSQRRRESSPRAKRRRPT
jgi:hypothetical protein